jgi:hypothetical protein
MKFAENNCKLEITSKEEVVVDSLDLGRGYHAVKYSLTQTQNSESWRKPKVSTRQVQGVYSTAALKRLMRGDELSKVNASFYMVLTEAQKNTLTTKGYFKMMEKKDAPAESGTPKCRVYDDFVNGACTIDNLVRIQGDGRFEDFYGNVLPAPEYL